MCSSRSSRGALPDLRLPSIKCSKYIGLRHSLSVVTHIRGSRRIPTVVWQCLGHVTWKMIWALFSIYKEICDRGMFPQSFGSVFMGKRIWVSSDSIFSQIYGKVIWISSGSIFFTDFDKRVVRGESMTCIQLCTNIRVTPYIF